MSDAYTNAVQRLSRVDGVQGALIAEAATGVPVLAELADEISGTALAALTTALFRRTAQASGKAGFGRLQSLQLEAAEGHVLAVGAGEVILVVLAAGDAQLGLIRLEAHRAAEALA